MVNAGLEFLRPVRKLNVVTNGSTNWIWHNHLRLCDPIQRCKRLSHHEQLDQSNNTNRTVGCNWNSVKGLNETNVENQIHYIESWMVDDARQAMTVAISTPTGHQMQ